MPQADDDGIESVRIKVSNKARDVPLGAAAAERWDHHRHLDSLGH